MRHFLLSALFLSSCGYIGQLQEQRRLDAAYQQYLTEAIAPSPLSTAKFKASSARIQVMPDFGFEEPCTITLSAEELDTIRKLNFKKLPPLNRQAWEASEKGDYAGPLHAGWMAFKTLELLDSEGKVIGRLQLTIPLASEEEMGSERTDALRYTPDAMLPEAQRKQFYALPSIRQAMR